MPRYGYKCPHCESVQDEFVSYADRLDPKTCDSCGAYAYYQFPVEAALGFQPFEPYYDEALDGDITGRKDKKLFLKSEGLIEAGDKVHGSRNFDKHAREHIKPQKPRGYSVWQAKEKQRIAQEKAKAFSGEN